MVESSAHASTSDASSTLIVWHRIARWPSDGADELAALSEWARRVRGRFLAAGGDVLAYVSGTVVGAFPAEDAHDVLEMVIDLVAEADASAMPAALGVACSKVVGGVGPAVEAAELLASRAQPGEVVLDAAARERAGEQFLFGRQVAPGAGLPRGSAIDRNHPRRDLCAEALSRLGPVRVAPSLEPLIDPLVAALKHEGLALLRAPVGAGASELIAAAAALAKPQALWVIGGAPGGVVPLASLRYALLRAFGTAADVVAAVPRIEDRASIESLLAGGLPRQSELASAFASLVESLAGQRGSVWLFLAPLAMVDAATLEVILSTHEVGGPISIVARASIDAALPRGLDKAVELTLPPLRTADAWALAEGLLGDKTSLEVARRVAVLGGETPLGVLEAARTFVAAGDLVATDEGFVWRGHPRSGSSTVALEELLLERLESIPEEARRMLEVVCACPEGVDREFVLDVGARDGLAIERRERALSRLANERWLSPIGLLALGSSRADSVSAAEVDLAHPAPASGFLRRLMVSSMPPARRGELCRFVAEALIERGAEEPGRDGLAAELAWFELEGGLEERGARRLAESARSTLERGHRRATARIASLLTGMGIEGAEELSRAVTTMRPSSWDDEQAPPSTEFRLSDVLGEFGASDVARGMAAAAKEAVRRKDSDALGALAQRAVAGGSDLAAVARFRAMADLLRGDVRGAVRGLSRARTFGAQSDGNPKDAIAEAALFLGSGEPSSALRAAVRALADARRASDVRGEHAAIKTLAACCRMLGREESAARLDAWRPAQGLPGDPRA